MLLDVADLPLPTTDEQSVRPGGELVRTPLYFASRGEPLFAWWHECLQRGRAAHAAVIAAPLGYEQIHSHRTLRHLADALALRGIPALRFDWHGTGDSAGLDEDPDRWTVWQTNLQDAVRLVKQQFAIPSVGVIGMRLGALLAATSLTADDIDRLVLWAPVVSGRTYVRELTAIDRTSEIPNPTQPGEPPDLEPSGCVLTAETAEALLTRSLLDSIPVVCPTLIVSRAESTSDVKLVEAYRAAGIPIDQATFAGYADLMNSPHKGLVPQAAIQDIVAWLAGHAAAAGSTAPDPAPAVIQQMVCRQRPEGRHSSGAGVEVRERALQIAAAPDLFGILSEPLLTPDAARPVIVLLNAGSAHRVGPGRLNVHLARRLAAEGYRCLRIDANGLGDSVAPFGIKENDSYAATILRDVDRTLQFLQAQRLGQNFVLLGLCSGAYHAFQSAVALDDAALVESILINPLTYFWKDGMVIEESTDRQVLVQQYYFESALDYRKWRKFLSGRTKIGLWGAAKLLGNAARLAVRKLVPARASGENPSRPPYSHPLRDDLPADLEQVVAHNRRLTMLFAQGDPGYGILLHKAGRAAKRLERSGRLRLELIPGADHNFSRRAARETLLAALVQHLASRYNS